MFAHNGKWPEWGMCGTRWNDHKQTYEQAKTEEMQFGFTWVMQFVKARTRAFNLFRCRTH